MSFASYLKEVLKAIEVMEGNSFSEERKSSFNLQDSAKQIQGSLKNLASLDAKAWVNLFKEGVYVQKKDQDSILSQHSLETPQVENATSPLPTTPPLSIVQSVKDPSLLERPKILPKPMPLDPLAASQPSEWFRAFIFILALFALAGFLSWDWIIEILAI